MPQIKEYLDELQRSPFARWFNKLDARAAAKVTMTLARLEAGNLSETKGVGAGVLEKLIHFGPGYRIYFGCDGARLVVLLGGGSKQGQNRDIDKAKARWLDYRRRKGEGEPWR